MLKEILQMNWIRLSILGSNMIIIILIMIVKTMATLNRMTIFLTSKTITT